jgi:asparagine synthase (glutamine-hydrolysing)
MAKSLANNKNMYYYQNKSLIFASEIKALLAYPAIKKEVDIISLNNFLTFRHIPSPHTFFKDIKRLNAGCVLSYDYKNRLLKEEDIGYISIKDNVHNLSEKDTLIAVWQKLNDSIGIRMKKAKKAGLFLSGGIDSSALLYFLSHNTKDIKTYTAGGLEGDLLFSRKVSKFFHIENIGVNISAKDAFAISPKALWYSELPFCGPDAFQYLLSKSAEKEKFMFWGQGSEEIFFGRHDYVILDKLERIKNMSPLMLLGILNKRLRGIPNESRMCKLLNVYCARDCYDTYISMRETFTERERESILDRQYFLDNDASLERIHITNHAHLGDNLLRNYSFLVLKNGYLSDVFPAMGYELMNPYMDKNFLNFLYALPNKIKIKNNRIRYLLSKMMTGNLPAYIIKRRKEYWNAQTMDWVKSNTAILYLYIKKLKKRGYIRNSLKIEDYFRLGKFGMENKLWSLFTLELLHEIFIDKTYANEPPALMDFITA